MTETVQALVAVTPILLAAVLLVGFRVPARHAMPVVYIAAAALAWGTWRVDVRTILASSIGFLSRVSNEGQAAEA